MKLPSLITNFLLLEENHENPFRNNQYENIPVQNVVYSDPLYAHTIALDLTKQINTKEYFSIEFHVLIIN